MTTQPDRVAQVVAWLREYGNHPPLPNCERCQIADAIEAGEPFKETPDA